MSEQDDYQLLTIDQWNDWWKKDYESGGTSEEQCEKHEVSSDMFGELSPMLTKHSGHFFKQGDCNRIFVPLCGTSIDMKWLADQGQEVIGLECSEHAILKFFEKNTIEFEKTISTVDSSFCIFKGKTSKIAIFQGDFFKFTSEIAGGLMDTVWDTASLNTIDLVQREKYVEVMHSLLKYDARYVLSAMFFGEKRTWKNNPFDISEDDMKQMFGSDWSWELIDKDDSEWGLEQVYLLRKMHK